MHWRSTVWKLAILGAAFGFTSVFFIKWCDLIYRCGCTFDWAGAAAHCNIHQPGPPDCPWCASRLYGGIAFFFVAACQAAVALWPGSPGWRRLALALAASPAAAALIGVAIGLWTGYWS